MILKYLKSRLSLLRFFGLALLFTLFVLPSDAFFQDFISQSGFLLFSFLVFRILDDLGSVHFDRVQHPDRSYLWSPSFPKIIRFGAGVLFSYLILIWVFMPIHYVIVIGSFSGISILAYLLFENNQNLLPLIPILKYPVLLWCLTDLSLETEQVLLLASTAIIIASHDSLERLNSGSNRGLYRSLFYLMLVGFLVFQPWNVAFQAIYILPIVLAVWLLRNWKYVAYLPVLYYPLVYFNLNISFS